MTNTVNDASIELVLELIAQENDHAKEYEDEYEANGTNATEAVAVLEGLLEDLKAGAQLTVADIDDLGFKLYEATMGPMGYGDDDWVAFVQERLLDVFGLDAEYEDEMMFNIPNFSGTC